MKDIHVVRYFSSLITISSGKVIKVTKPVISHCPLAGFLYAGLKKSGSPESSRLKNEIKKIIEGKISEFGFCSKNRVLWDDGASIPYGASEIMAYGLSHGKIDCAVLVCDGAGTVITNTPELVQGIGARMNSVLCTSAIPEVLEGLYQRRCLTVFNNGKIDQCDGVREAAGVGYDKIAVTVNAYRGEELKMIRLIEKQSKVNVTILMTCATGVGSRRIDEMVAHADIVWACHSAMVRKRMEKVAIKRLSSVSPVYILTKKGADLVSGYLPNIFKVRKEVLKRPGSKGEA